MKALLITHHWKPYTHHSPSSGYQRIVYYLQPRCDVSLLTWHRSGTPPVDDRQEPFPVYRLTTPASDMLLERRLMLSWHARRLAPAFDIVHALYCIPALFPAMRRPTVATVHVLPEIKPGLWTRYHGLIQSLVFRRAAHIIAVSTNLYEILADRYGTDRVTYIPHGVDRHVFKPGCPAAPEMRERLLGNRFRMMAMLVGGHGSGTDLIRSLAVGHPEVLFAVVDSARPSKWSGEQRHFPEDLPNVMRLRDMSEEHMIALYDGADLFFRPLAFATANNALLEAMAMGKGIVVHRIPGVTDYLDASTAFLAQDDEEFLAQFQYAVDHPEERMKRGQRARARVESEFAWEHVAGKTVAIYERVKK